MLTPSTVIRRAITAGTLAMSLAANSATAQDAPSRPRSWEIRVPSGAMVGTGAQRDHVKDAHLTAIQLAWLVQPGFALTGTLGWARSRDLSSANTPKLDVFSSDVGIETRSQEWFAEAPVSLSLFAGAGAGARTYNYAKLDLAATNNLAGYVSAGGELGRGRMALRVEVRNYTTGFRPLAGSGKSDARNDVVILAAVRFTRRPSGAR